MKKFERASSIKDSDVAIFYDTDEDEIAFKVKGKSESEYLISCVHGLWRCDCEDYLKAKDKHLGSYLCKHILKCIDYQFRVNRCADEETKVH